MKEGIIITMILFSSMLCFSQDSKGKINACIPTVLISSSLTNSSLSQLDLDTGFFIQVKDTSFRIISFALTYPAKYSGDFALQRITFQGDKVIVDAKYPKLWKVTVSDFIALDEILVEKAGQQCYAKPFIVTIKN